MATAALDRVLPLAADDIAELKRPHSVIEEALKNTDTVAGYKNIIGYGKALKRVGQVSGVNMAQYLYLLKSDWETISKHFNLGDAIEDIVSSELGVTAGTFKKYTRAWAMLYGTQEGEGFAPAKLRPQLLARPIEQQLLLTAAAPELKPAQWASVATAHDKAAVKAVVLKVRGARTSSKVAINIWIKRDGSLVAKQGKGGKPVVLGVLRTSEADMKDTVRAAAISRLLGAAGVQEE